MGLDGVEIVMAWEEAFGVSITDAEAAVLRTPQMATDLICRMLNADEGSGPCLSQKIFYRLRRAFVQVLTRPRASINPQMHLGELVPIRGRQRVWSALAREAHLPFPTKLIGIGSWSPTVGEFCTEMVARSARALIGTSRRWSRCQVRQVVRAVVSSQLGIKKFSDDADFIYDLRLD